MSKIKIKDFITALAKKAGVEIDTKNPELVDFLAANSELPTSITDALNANLLTVDAAIEHDTVRDRILAASLGAIDKDLLKRAEDLGLTDLIDPLKTEKSTRKKITTLLEAALDAEKKKKAAKGDDATKALDAEIAKLNKELKELNEGKANEITSLKDLHTNELVDLYVESQLSGYDYADLPGGKEFAVKFAKDSVTKTLNDKKGKLVLDGKTLKVVKADTGGELFDDKHQKVELKGLLDTTVAPLLKKADPNPPKNDEIIIPPAGAKADTKTANTLNTLATEIAAG